MSDSINEQRCVHGKTADDQHERNGDTCFHPFACFDRCTGPFVVTPPVQDGPLCYWTGHDCICGASAVMSYEQRLETCHGRRTTSSAAPSVSTDRADEHFRAETVTSAYLTKRLRMDNGQLCTYCARQGSALWVGPGDVRQWVCEVHLNSTGPRFGSVAGRG